MRLPNRIRRPSLALLAAFLLSPFAARAADIYVLEALMERDGVSSISPTFIVTPGERALLTFDGERDLDVAMTLTPRAAASGGSAATEGGAAADGFELRVELIDGVELHDQTVPVSLAETETLELAGRTIKVLVRVQEALGESAEPAPVMDVK